MCQIQRLLLIRILLPPEGFFQRAEDQGKRRAQFVRNVREKADLHLLDLGLPLLLCNAPSHATGLAYPQNHHIHRHDQQGSDQQRQPHRNCEPAELSPSRRQCDLLRLHRIELL